MRITQDHVGLDNCSILHSSSSSEYSPDLYVLGSFFVFNFCLLDMMELYDKVEY